MNLGILSNDSVNTLLRNVLLSFAQFERDMIVQRTQEGKAVARATDPNFREGRPPKFDTEQLDHAMALLEDHSYAQVVKLTGISKSTLIRERAAAGVMPHGAIYNKISVRSNADKTTERLKMQSLGCFAYDAEVSAVLII